MNAPDSILDMLLAAQLHPTLARIAILRVLADTGPHAIGMDDIYRALVARGAQAAMSTVYRIIQDMEARRLILREWGNGHRKAIYRLRPKALDDPACVHLVCRESGRVVTLGDAALHAHLLQAARTAEVDLAGQVLRIEVSHLKAPGASAAGRARPVRGPRLVSQRS